MLRRGQLLALDGDAVELAAAGLVRLGVRQWREAEAVAEAWRIRADSFAGAWLDFGNAPAPDLRVPAGPVLRSVVHRAARLLLEVHDGDGPAVLEQLGLRAAQARDQARRTDEAHPGEPVALALVWHDVQALTAGDQQDHGRHIDDRCEAYIREGHQREDVLALIVASVRLAVEALAELSGRSAGRAAEQLDEHAARHMPRRGPAPLWVPGQPPQPAAG